MKKIVGASLTALALAIGGPAHAGYIIRAQTSASTGSIYDRAAASCRYNYNGTGGDCSGSGVYSATVSPLGGDGTATSMTMATSVSGAGATANTQVGVDLATGSIHFYAADSNVIGNCSTALACGSTGDYARYDDTLHFAVAGATSATVTPISLIFTLEGTMRNQGTDTYDNNASGEIFGALAFGNSNARFDLKSNYGTGYLTEVGYLDGFYPAAQGVWTTNADHSINTFTQTYFLTGANIDLGVALEANLSCSLGYVCDFSNTAKMGLTLPSNVSFTSDSGVFLTANAQPGAVPEPATWAMMMLGFGGVGIAMRRKQRASTRVRFA